MPLARGILGRSIFYASIAVGTYSALLGLLLTPSLQRFALYANNINTLFLGDDLDNGEAYGFAKHQVTAFKLRTPDGETLFAWHVLPLDIYTRNHDAIVNAETRPHGSADDFTQTTAFEYLSNNDARVVINFHGNAGHIAQGWRTDTYRYLSTQSNTHVLTIDYRGFGHSTGSPTEAGLIVDGTALVDWLLTVAHTPPERIVILGQSLGTAVASAVALNFADPENALIPAEARRLPLPAGDVIPPTLFAGVILVASFSSLPSLMLTYRIGGFLPILLPLRPFSQLAGWLTGSMVDKWLTAERLEAYYRTVSAKPELLGAGAKGREMGSLQLFHSIRDYDIPYQQTEMICRRIFGGGREAGVYNDEGSIVECVDGSSEATTLDIKAAGRPRIRFEIVEYGGHNRIVTYSTVNAGVLRAFEDLSH